MLTLQTNLKIVIFLISVVITGFIYWFQPYMFIIALFFISVIGVVLIHPPKPLKIKSKHEQRFDAIRKKFLDEC
jgi:ABC-type bacteriocin/lantibiotic exporter with double-glycine peptidase domain